MMYEEKLRKLGLNKNEAKVFDVLITKQKLTAGEIIKETKIHRNLVYQSLERLVDLGLISFIIENKVKTFSLETSNTLIEFIEPLEKELEEKKDIAQELREVIDTQEKILSTKQQATIFRGVNGVQTAMNIIMKKSESYYVLGAPKESVELMPPEYWVRYNKILRQKKIKVSMIFNESLRDWTKKKLSNTIEIRFLPKRFDSIAQTNICIDSIFIFIWSKTPLVIYIQDKNLAETYKNYFNQLWKTAKK